MTNLIIKWRKNIIHNGNNKSKCTNYSWWIDTASYRKQGICKDNEVVIVFSEEIENNDSTDLETARMILHESTRKEYQLHGVQC